MLLERQDPETGLPLVKEDRKGAFASLPRKPFGDLLTKTPTSWCKDWLSWEGGLLSHVRCWKCGRDLRSWRASLDRFGNQVVTSHATLGPLSVGQFLMLPHYRAKKWQVRRPALGQTVEFHVLHCADCAILATDGAVVIALYLGGLHLAYQHAQTLQVESVDVHGWASWISRWQRAESLGPVERSDKDPFWED